jgi:hypothetical protein
MQKEDLVYKDDDYEIYKKDSGAVGTFFAEAEIADIGLTGLGKIKDHFADENDYNKLIDGFIGDLENLKRKK